ncbi:MAG TPA: NAD(P)-dependent oxidoreductase [Gemmatimonadaceae bacterium]
MSTGQTPARRAAPRSEDELEDRLSSPTAGVVDALSSCPGDILILGAGGKMGVSLAGMARRAADTASARRRVIAVSRFRTPSTALRLRSRGIETVTADLANRDALDSLPDAPNVIYLAGQKFGTRESPGETWATNVVVPAQVAERFHPARIVALSTGNIYPLTPVTAGGSREEDAPGPVGEYAWSCLGRERVLEHASGRRATRIAIVRLNYAVDLRYGVLVDLALRVASGAPIDLRMGHVNVIWQGDACARIIQCLPLATAPPYLINVTGAETLSIRELAGELGRRLRREPVLSGTESGEALLSSTSRALALFGPPSVSSADLLAWVAEWVSRGGATLGKPTHFEERGGSF